jgi:hypothetical protein
VCGQLNQENVMIAVAPMPIIRNAMYNAAPFNLAIEDHVRVNGVHGCERSRRDPP